MKVISFSLWGNDPKYTIGAVYNAMLAPVVYPGWTARFYVGTSTSSTIRDKLVELGAQVVLMDQPGDWRGMFWRFLPAGEDDVEVMISRDTDSRLGVREKLAVDDWLASGQDFHIMRDHPAHAAPILGGMWGARRGVLQDIRAQMDGYSQGDFWQVDQNFLRDVVYPLVAGRSRVHDEFFEKRPFPSPRRDFGFVGEVFDSQNVRHPVHWRQLAAHLGQHTAPEASNQAA